MRTVNTPEIRADHDISEALEYWQQVTLDQVRNDMVNPTTITTQTGHVGLHILEPRGEVDDSLTVIRFSEHQQAYSPMQHIGAAVVRDVLFPNSRVIMFDNNRFTHTSQAFGEYHEKQLKAGNMRPFAEDCMLAAESLGVKSAIVTGYSKGGIMAAEFVAAGSDRLTVTHLNIDEAPSKTGRTPKELQKDFLNSCSWGDQRAAMQESGIPALEQLRKAYRLGTDYALFGLASLMSHNRLMHQAMRGSIGDTVDEIIVNSPDVAIKLGKVAGSLLFDESSLTMRALNGGVDLVEYDGLHRHPSVNNPMVATAMLSDCLRTVRV